MITVTGLGPGAYVHHRIPTINNGLRMEVIEVDSDKDEVLCSLDDGAEEWFKLEDLTLVEDAPNGFDLKQPGQ